MNGYKIASYFGFFFVLIGFILIAYGLVNMGVEMKLNQKGIKTIGKVYDLNVVPPYRQAMVEFTTNNGRTVRFVDKLFWNVQFNKYQIGQEVVVIYDPSNPEATAIINDFFQRNTMAGWPILLGVIVIILGLIYRRSMKRKAVFYESYRSGAVPYNHDFFKKSTNRTVLWMFIFVIIMILILVIAFGIYGEY